MKMEKTIRFSNLSLWLKTLVILGWIYTVIFGIQFMISFVTETIRLMAI